MAALTPQIIPMGHGAHDQKVGRLNYANYLDEVVACLRRNEIGTDLIDRMFALMPHRCSLKVRAHTDI